MNQYKQREMQRHLWKACNLHNNMKYFVTTLLRYLSTDVIIPLTSRFEAELPDYATIDAFAEGFEHFLQQVYEQCFLISESLRVALVDMMNVCLAFAQFVRSELKEERSFGKRKEDVAESSVSEDMAEEGLKDVPLRVQTRVKALEEVVCSTQWQEEVERMRSDFEERRTQFLQGLEQLPGFLQSVFLPLDRKLMQKYVMEFSVCCDTCLLRRANDAKAKEDAV